MPFLSGGLVTSNVYQAKFKFGDTGSNRTRWTTNLYYRTVQPNIDADTFDVFVSTMLDNFALMMFRNFTVLGCTISTIQADSDPYNANEFKSYFSSIQGALVDTGQSVHSPRFAVRIIRRVNSGRRGNLYIRGCLSELNTVASPDGMSLVSPTPSQIIDFVQTLGAEEVGLRQARDVYAAVVTKAPAPNLGSYITRDVAGVEVDDAVTIFKQRNR